MKDEIGMSKTDGSEATVLERDITINPQELRDHADRIEADDVPAVRAGALLREAADQMQGFFNTREMRRIELERLYAIEKAAVNRDSQFADMVGALEELLPTIRSVDPETTAAITKARAVLDNIKIKAST